MIVEPIGLANFPVLGKCDRCHRESKLHRRAVLNTAVWLCACCWKGTRMSVHITSFVRRQTPQSGFSHWNISDEVLLDRIERNLKKMKPGYREGVILVPVEPDGFFSSIVQLKEGDILVGEYKARQPGETPRKSTGALSGSKMPAKSVDIVLYHHDVLKENNENETDCTWEIVSVNASPTKDETPIPMGALIANHLELSGGTATKMTDTEFVQLLRKSVAFWSDKANTVPDELRKRFTI